MSPQSATRSIYKVLRSLLFTVVLTVIGLTVALYVVLSLPAVQDYIKRNAEKELTSLLGGEVTIGKAYIYPFNEVRLTDVGIKDPEGARCINVGSVGTAIDLWKLLTQQEVKITYAEVIGLSAQIKQLDPEGRLNIQFIIDAFKQKEKKEPSKVKIALRNVVIRKSTISYDKTYIPRNENSERMDFNHIRLEDLNADLAFPYICGDTIRIDLRRLAFKEQSGLNIAKLSFKSSIAPDEISVQDLLIKAGNSVISLNDQTIKVKEYGSVAEALKRESRKVLLKANPLYPSDFAHLLPQLSSFGNKGSIFLSAEGNADNVDVDLLDINYGETEAALRLTANLVNLQNPSSIKAALKDFDFKASSSVINNISDLISGLSPHVSSKINALGNISIEADGVADLAASTSKFNVSLACDAGDINTDGLLGWKAGAIALSDFRLISETFDLGKLLPESGLGKLALDLNGNLAKHDNNLEGDLKAIVPFVEYRGRRFEEIEASVVKKEKTVTGDVKFDNAYGRLTADAEALINGTASQWKLNAVADKLNVGIFGKSEVPANTLLSANIDGDVVGNGLDSFTGNVNVDNLRLLHNEKAFTVDNLSLSADLAGENRTYSINSDFLNGNIRGQFTPTALFAMVRNLAAAALPTFVSKTKEIPTFGQFAEAEFTLEPASRLFDYLKASNRPGTPVQVKAYLDGTEQKATADIDAPYIIKGRDKLIKGTRISAVLHNGDELSLRALTNFPLKHDRALVDLNANCKDGETRSIVKWTMEGNADNTGRIDLDVAFNRNPMTRSLGIDGEIKESGFRINGSDWKISPSRVIFSDKKLYVSGLNIGCGNQFIDISGLASDSPLDFLTARLAGVDLGYVFDILNINYVDFAGRATGVAVASCIFSPEPVARTRELFVKNLAYNGCVLGDGQLEGYWDNKQKMVGINADILADDGASAKVRGGVYVTRDSLAFNFDANRIDAALIKPFVRGFTSSIAGRASGQLKLYGTFSDIDLVGRVHADTVTMKVDHTNVYYSGADSLFFDPGRITIPEFRLYDKYGHSALLTGEVKHDFLHNPTFNFELTNARNLLVYDTDAKSGDFWYGHVFANGRAKLRGVPGMVLLDLDMRTSEGTKFTISLDDSREANEYTFLTFTDKSKEVEIQGEQNLNFEEQFSQKLLNTEDSRPDLFSLDMSLDITPAAKLEIIMDPIAGDKIKAEGNGAMQMHYDSDTDDMTVYGKYVLDKGDYNFSLQDLILKNFKIEPGSSISFNGDPNNGLLNITAAYRVNTNLADLDASFRNDPDLNRTMVPVDALLKVRGEIDHPDINFDIKLPSVTSEVERKMRSLISTDDMMNRQVIYLLALNRFYSPQYSTGESGGELASVASSTLSSQIQNVLGSLTDKFSVAPSIKSDKSDLSDMEFDVALSSSLFDNRLLINGNLGYRDKSTSQTTFVGDFDIEYLLNREGRLRLKAYNHFNDASYYLKSALTTQGIGIVYRKDFDQPFTFLKKIFRRKEQENDSVKTTKR